MNSGRFPYNMKQRSIIRPIKKYAELSGEFAQNYDCAAAAIGGSCAVAALTAGCVGKYFPLELFLNRALNTVYSRGARPYLINVSLVWSADSDEEACRAETERLSAFCAHNEIKLGAVSQRFSHSVREGCTVSINAVGEAVRPVKIPAEGQTIVMAGYAGQAGTAILARADEEFLSRRFTKSFIAQAQKAAHKISIKTAVCAAGETAFSIYPLGEGGVLAALWDWADGVGLGLEADQLLIPISQETVEITEAYDNMNPYTMASDGACLIATDNAEQLVEALRLEGIRAAVIGRFTGEKAKLLRRNDEVRYIDKPAQDALEMYNEGKERK